jgi:hypothetical protein
MAKFIKTDYGTEGDEVSQYLRLTRGDNMGLFNIIEQQSYSDTETPGRIWGGITHLWMSEPLNTVYEKNSLYTTGPDYIMKSWVRNLWENFNPDDIDIDSLIEFMNELPTNEEVRELTDEQIRELYINFSTNLPMVPWEIIHQSTPPSMLNKEMIMLDTQDGKFYKIKFLSWTSGNAGGGFSYTRLALNDRVRDSLLKRITTPNNKIPLSTGELQYVPYISTSILPGETDPNAAFQKYLRNNLYYPNIFNDIDDKITRQQLSPSDFVGVYPGDHTKPYGGSIYFVEVDRFTGTNLSIDTKFTVGVIQSLNGNGRNIYANGYLTAGNIYDFTFNNPDDVYYINPNNQNLKYTNLINNSDRITITLYQNEFNDIIFNSDDFSVSNPGAVRINGSYLALDVTIVRYGTASVPEVFEGNLPTYKIRSVSLAKLPINQVISIGRTSDKDGGFNIGNTIGGFYWNQNDTISIDINSIFGFEFVEIAPIQPTIELTVNNTRAYPMWLDNRYSQYNGIGFMPGEKFSVIPSGDRADQIIFKVSHIKPNPSTKAGPVKEMNSLTSFTQVQSLDPIGDSPFNTGYNYSSGSQFTTFNRALLRYDRFTKKLYSSVTIGDPVTAKISEVNISASNEVLVEDLAQSAKLPVVSDFSGDYDLSADLKSAYIYLSAKSRIANPSINDISIIGESKYPGEYFTASVSETISLNGITVSNMSIIYNEESESYSTLKLDFVDRLPYDVDILVDINLYDSIEVSTRNQESSGRVSIPRTPNPIPENYLGTTYDEKLDGPYFTDEIYNFTLYNSDFLASIGLNSGDTISSVGFPFHLTEATDSLNVTDEMIDSEEFKLAFNIVSTRDSDLNGELIRSTFVIDDNFDQSILNPFIDKKPGIVRTINGQRYVFFQIKENFTYTDGNIIITYYMDGNGNSWTGGYTQSEIRNPFTIPYGSEVLAASSDNNWDGSTFSNVNSIMASIVLNHLI